MNKKFHEKLIKISKSIIVFIIVLISVVSIQNTFATGSTGSTNNAIQSGAETLQDFAGKAGVRTGNMDLISVITNIINLALGLLGLFFLVLILMGGFQWMGSGGEDDKINKAKGIIKSASIGLFIVLASWIIAKTVLWLFNHGTGGPEVWLGGTWGWW